MLSMSNPLLSQFIKHVMKGMYIFDKGTCTCKCYNEAINHKKVCSL